MTETFSTQVDPIAERRSVLAKIYMLLIRLSEEAENHTASPDEANTNEEEKGEPMLAADAPASE